MSTRPSLCTPDGARDFIPTGLCAAGKGLKVMLIESRGYVGGNLTLGLPILGFLGRKGNQVIEGLPQMLINRLRTKGKASEHKPCKNHVSLTIIDPEAVKDEAMAFARVMSTCMAMGEAAGRLQETGCIWEERREVYRDVILAQKPDIICMQEVIYDSNEYMKKELKGYTSFGFSGPEMDHFT